MPQCISTFVVSSKRQHDKDTQYKGIRAELNWIKAQMQSVRADTINNAAAKGSSGVQPAKVSKIDVQNKLLQLPIGSPPCPADPMVAMADFRQEHVIDCQPYTLHQHPWFEQAH